MTTNTKYLALLAAVLLMPATAFAQQESTATFIIEKIWNQDGETDALQVTGHLSCTGAVSTQQNVVFTATTDAVLFVYDIINIPEGQQVDCRITEDVPDNYIADYEESGCQNDNCGDSDTGIDECFWPDVDFDGQYTCTITNRPEPAVMEVTKTWVIEGADQGFRGDYCIHAECTSPVIGGNQAGCDRVAVGTAQGPEEIDVKKRRGGLCWATACVSDASDATFGFTITKPNYPETRCEFWEETYDSVIESEGCEGYWRLGAGAEADCEIVNTVFFEGIPTLSQYGMAILALLMLGVGLVGFRRFV